MAASAQVALVIAVLKVLGSSRVPVHRSYMCTCMTDSARDKDDVTKDKKITICLI